MADVFISHASEDKNAIARPLAQALANRGYQVWYDEFTLRVGDSLPQEIDRGLAACLYGVVILSPHFFSKEWPRRELDGLVARETTERAKRILPIWHNVTQEIVAQHSPTLASKLAALTSNGFDSVVDAIVAVLGPPPEAAPAEQTMRQPAAPKMNGPARMMMPGDRIARIVVPFTPPRGINIPPGYQPRLNQHAARIARESAVRDPAGGYRYPAQFRGSQPNLEAFAQAVSQLGAQQIETDMENGKGDLWFEYAGSHSPDEIKELAEKHDVEVVHCGAWLTIRPGT